MGTGVAGAILLTSALLPTLQTRISLLKYLLPTFPVPLCPAVVAGRGEERFMDRQPFTPKAQTPETKACLGFGAYLGSTA